MCVRACVCVCEAETKREKEGKSAAGNESERNWMCVHPHEAHFTQLSTYILHLTDEVSEKVAVLWQIKSASCKSRY